MRNVSSFLIVSSWILIGSMSYASPSSPLDSSSSPSPISNGLSPTPNPNDDDRKPAARRNDTRAAASDDDEEQPASDDDSNFKEEQDTDDDDDDDDDDTEECAKDQYNTFNAEEKAKLMKTLPDDLKGAKLNVCTYDEPKLHIQRPDGAILDTAKINKCLKKFENANDVLNHNGAGSCSPGYPGMYCVVHVNCPSTNMEVYDISMVSEDTYYEIKSAILLRYEMLALNVPHIRDTTKRGFFYWEERKDTPPDLGYYTNQKYAEHLIAFLSNLLCVPTSVLYRSSTKSFFFGPPGVTIKRPELANTQEYEATINQKPYGASKGHEINVEWALEWNRVLPVRKFTNFDKVKCIVLIEKEGKLIDMKVLLSLIS